MLLRGSMAACLTVLALTVSGSPVLAAADVSQDARAARSVSVRTSVAAVDEGDRYGITVKLKKARTAKRLVLQKETFLYPGAAPEWRAVRSVRVRGRSVIRFRVVATEENRERYRAVVTYRKQRARTSVPAAVRVWRWIPLSDYRPYYDTGGTHFSTASINGMNYPSWGPWRSSTYLSWEARFTPGRHCDRFRAVAGLSDTSADGSSGTITVLADDKVVAESGPLTPGMSRRIDVALAKPYRLALRSADTGPEGARSWPLVGEPALRCTGV